MAQTNALTIEKLKGRENYNSWKFAMQALLEHEDLWQCVEGTETDQSKITKARAKLILSVDPTNYPHIHTTKTAKEAWDKLREAFEDSGLTRKVGLLRTLITTHLDNCSTVDEYTSKIIITAHKLNDLQFPISDEWIGTLLLAGLPDTYRPMIMGLESSGTKITGDAIKTKLLQDVKIIDPSTNQNSAMYARSSEYNRKKSTFNKKKVRCYNCNQNGHFASECRLKRKENKQDNGSSNDHKSFYAFYSPEKKKTDRKALDISWFLDSCSSSHMTNNKELLIENVRPTNSEITAADNVVMKAELIGTAYIPIDNKGKTSHIKIEDVLFVPSIKANLLSITRINNRGNAVTFKKNKCEITAPDGTVIATGSEFNGIYKLDQISLDMNKRNEEISLISSEGNETLWHRRLGHMNRKDMRNLHKFVCGYKKAETSNEPCIPCIEAKQHKQPFPRSKIKSTEILQLVHSDLCGPMEQNSFGGAKYLLTLIDDYSRYAFVYFLKTKDQVSETFRNFKAMVEKQTDRKLKKLRTDNGREYVNSELLTMFQQNGIKHQFTIPYNPQQNGVAERFNRTIVEKAKSMLFTAKLPKIYWAEAVSTAIFLLNRSLNHSIESTPFELWCGSKPDISDFKVFGCQTMSHIPKEKRKKWDRKSEQLLFMGYNEDSKGYRLINPTTKKITRSRDVIFLEDRFLETNEGSSIRTHEKDETVSFPLASKEISVTENSEDSSGDEEDTTSSTQDDSFRTIINSESDPEFSPPLSEETNEEEKKIHPQRNRRKKSFGEDFITYLTENSCPEDPSTMQEALNSTDRRFWKEAIDSEYKSLIENKTWTEVTLDNIPDNQQVLDTKWVFKMKLSEQNHKKFKARLVARGFRQIHGLNYKETYSPVVRYNSIRFLFALSINLNMKIHHMDVDTAYLQGNLEENIYIHPPEFYEEKHSNRNVILKLNKAIYGLKQSGRAWNLKLNDVLQKLNYVRSKADQCIYWKEIQNDIVIIAIYVDDLIVICKREDLLQKEKENLKKHFKMKDLGKVKHLLGMKIDHDTENGILTINQSKYITDILQKFNMSECKPVSSPFNLSSNGDFVDSPETTTTHRFPYRESIGSLLFLSQISRPDIGFAVGVCSQYSQDPQPCHWTAVKRIMRYLHGTIDMKLRFDRKAPFILEGFSDADWANDKTNRMSISGYVFVLQGGAISWNSKKQRTVALSSTEAEYIALSAAAQECLWLRNLIQEIHPNLVQKATVIYCDNKSAIDISENAKYNPRTKHIDLRHHFLKDKIQSKEISVIFKPSEEMVADPLTKPTNGSRIKYMNQKIGLIQE